MSNDLDAHFRATYLEHMNKKETISKTKPVSIRLPIDLCEKIEKIAARKRQENGYFVSMTQILIKCIREAVGKDDF